MLLATGIQLKQTSPLHHQKILQPKGEQEPTNVPQKKVFHYYFSVNKFLFFCRDGSDQTEGNASSAAVQRRKRFSVKPKVIPGRPSTARATRSPVKASDETPVEVPEKADEGPETAGPTLAAAPRRLQSPRRRRPSEDSQQPKVQPEPTPVSSDSSAAATEDSQKPSHQSGDVSQQLETPSDCQDEESHFKVPEKVPPSLPSKEATEISERAKTLVSTKTSHSTSAAALSLSRLLNDPSDLHRLAKARKLRELLREEVRKERVSPDDPGCMSLFAVRSISICIHFIWTYFDRLRRRSSRSQSRGRRNLLWIRPK